MDEHRKLDVRVISGLRALQTAQAQYDADLWDITDPRFANLRHIELHLAITVGKFAKLLEPQDHRVHNGQEAENLDDNQVRCIVADLLIHAAQIANLQSFDLGEALAERYRHNAVRFAPDSSLKDFGASQ